MFSGRPRPEVTMSRAMLQTCVLVGLLAAGAHTAYAQTYDLSWYTIDGGGAMFTMGAGGLELSGTIGQFDAGSPAAPLSGGGYSLVGGFWAVAASAPCPGQRGDADCDGVINFFDIDPFVAALFDPVAYAAMYCGGALCTVDVDCSGSVNFFDIDPFLTCLFGGCLPCP
jgi:hypothetical protein